MQVSVESTSPLARRMTVGVSKELIQTEINKRLQSIGRTAKINGFRPGKIPQRILKQRYGNQVRQEVLSEFVQSSFYEALQQESLHIAGDPQIEFHGDVNSDKGDLSYTASFEVYPDISVNTDNLSIIKPQVEIAASDIDNMLQKLREQQRTWNTVERAATTDDRVVIDLYIIITGRTEPQIDTKAIPLVVNYADVIAPGLAAQLNGIKAGEQREFETHYPAEHTNSDIAGQTAQVKFTVSQVEERQLPDINVDFARNLGIENGDIEQLRNDVRQNMQRELDSAIHTILKRQVLDSLVHNNDVIVPESLVQRELQQLKENHQHNQQAAGTTHSSVDVVALTQRAQERVKLGLLINELVKVYQVQTTSEKIHATIERIAQPYAEQGTDPQSIIDWYHKNPKALREVEALVLEEQVVEILLEKAHKQEQSSSFDQIIEQYKEQATL